MTSLETLVEAMHSSRRSKLRLSVPFNPNPNGFESSELGARLLYWFIIIGLQSFKATSTWSLTCFVQYLMTHQLLSLSMLKLVTAMRRVLSTWTIGLNLMCHFWCACSKALAHLPRSAVTHLLRQALPQNVRRFLAEIGTWAFVKPLVRMGANMGFALSVKANTEQKTNLSVILSSKLDKEKELAEATQRAAKAREGPRTINSGLKRKLDTPLIDVPRFRRRYVWSNSTNKHLSPAALYTESAPPLPSPPAHLFQDQKIQASLLAMRDHIKVDTPFNVDKLESMLTDHTNQPFVQSVMTGL